MRWLLDRRPLLVLACVSVLGVVVLVLARVGHRAQPSPRGMVMRIVAREAMWPSDRFRVLLLTRDGARAIGVFAPEANGYRATFRAYRWPDGRLLDERTGLDAVRAFAAADALWYPPMLDLDGDGAVDGIEVVRPASRYDHALDPRDDEGEYGTIRIRSGWDNRLLLEDRDELEYEDDDRAVPLGDLDGDGCHELALLHPRIDRSRYDLELWDALLGARSWITVVSGARACR